MSAATEARPANRAAKSADIDLLAINTLRTLAVDAVQKADSGHAGAPMGLAAAAYTLWSRFLRYDPAHPAWPNRDRFVLSNGHASILLYSLIHLAGVQQIDARGASQGRPALKLEDLKAFRRLDSLTPGHPEYGHTTGVETTTGPLGQGCGDSIGMAVAGRWLGARFNRPEAALYDYDVYVICSDGDLMEGVASEAASLAGHLQLSNLCWIWDDNGVSIDGSTELAFTEDVAARFRAYGWAVVDVEDGNDVEAFARAVETFKATSDRPTFIRLKTVIGYGSPHLQGTAKIHSDAIGEEEVRLVKRAYGWPEDAQFLVPEGVRERFAETLGARGRTLHERWQAAFERYGAAHPDLARELELIGSAGLPDGWDADLPSFPADAKGMASREASGKVLNAIAPRVPWLVGGSADLTGSNKTKLEDKDAGTFEPGDPGGRYLHFGVREHAMGAIANGLALCGLRPFTGTFLIFSDYMRPPTRLAALMRQPVIFLFTHDSIGLGEDGPTHQPIEQLAALRAIPGMTVLRPCDANETAEAWRAILAQSDGPACLVLSRQALPTLDRNRYAPAEGLRRGGYVLADRGGLPDVILIASGSEVGLCIEAHERLKAEGVASRVVSMPSWELFERQDQAWRDQVLPPQVTARVAVERASPLGWDRYAGPCGAILAMRSFGASAPAKDLARKFGFTVEHLVELALDQVPRARRQTSDQV